MKKTFISKNPAETIKCGVAISGFLKKGDLLLLTGMLGAGKTVLTKGICKGLKVKSFINSPSFKIVNEYRGACPVRHIDLYRLNTDSDIENLGLDYYIADDGITIIEWGDKLTSRYLPDKFFKIDILSGNDNKRRIKIEKIQKAAYASGN